MFHIEGYQYSAQAISKVRQGHPLDLEVLDYQPLTLRQYITMRKSLALYAEYLAKSAPASISPAAKTKAAKKLGAGQRWITVHPNGRDDRGVPVLIQDHGDGTAHVVGGAAGRLNMLKLNNIKSKEEYRDIAKKKLEEARTKREAEKKALAIERAGMTEAQKKELRDQEKAAKEMQKEREKEKQEKIKTAKNAFLQTAASILGWEDRSSEMYENYQAQREGAVEYLKQALDSEDEAQIKAAKKNLSVVEKGYEQAVKSYESNMMQAAKAAIKDIQKEAIADETIKAALEERIEGKTEAEEAIQTEKKGKSKGFMTEYAETAEKQGLSEEQLGKEKEEIFQESLDRIARDVDPRLAMMIEAGVATKRAISEAKRDIYQKEDMESRVKELDDKAEMIKKYLEMKKVLKEEESGKDIKEVQVTLEGEAIDEKEQEMVYSDGATISTVSAEDFLKDLANEERRIEGERQGEINRSLLDKIAENPNDPAKWLANGRFDGFNKVALTLMKTDAISRDVSDVLGLRTTAQVLARSMRLSMSKEDFADAAEAVQRMHADSEEALAQNALDAANGIFEKVQEIESDIESLKAQNPDDLAQLQRLNATRLEYLDQANQVLAQTLGSLEATAMIGAEMKRGGAKGEVETNLGKISSEDAIYRLRALGLTDDEYHIETVSGNKVATITEAGLDKLARTVDPADLALEREIEDIKRGVYDEEGWMPAGLVARPLDSYQDPGIDPEIPEGGLDNQSIADDANGMKAAQEAAHRALGEIPEGGFAFKSVEDLDLSEQSDIRRYWEAHIYKGSMAEKYSVRQYQGEKGVTKAGAWQSFVSANGGMDDAAYEAILKNVIDNHSSEDMFGNKELPAIAQVIPGNAESYRNRVDGAGDLFDDIDTLRASIEQNLLTVPKATAEAELARKEAELPDRLEDLRRAQLRDHYHRWMSGYSEEQYAAGETGERYEGSAWAEYVRMHGDTKRAQQAVLDTIKGRFVDKFSKHYGRVTKKPLATEKRSIAESKGHLLGMLGKEERDSVINKVQAELASAGATVANRAGGKFATGSWRDRALELIQQRRSDEAKQGSFFGEEELKQDDGTERMSIGKRAEEQLASMLPELSRNQLRGQKYAVSSMTTKGERQRAIKMFEKTKRMNLSFGTGKGKTILSIASFTDLHAQGKAKRAIFAVPSVVQSQFGCVSYDTVLVDAVTGRKSTFKEMKDKGIEPNVFSLNKDGEVEIVKASVPFVKGKDLFYEVVLDNGSRVTVTANHKFFTPSGWKKLKNLSVGSRVFSDVSPLHDGTDARSRSLTVGCQGRYHPSPRSCGEPLRFVRGIFRYALPSQGRVVEHIQGNRPVDDFSVERKHIRRFYESFLLSSGLHSRLAAGGLFRQIELQYSAGIAELLTDGIHTVWQSILRFGALLVPTFGFCSRQTRSSLCIRSSGQALEGGRGLLFDSLRRLLPSCLRRILDRPISLVARDQRAFSCVPCRNTSTIVSIVQVFMGDVYDLEVPLNHNYWCQGFWNHNSEINVFCEPGKYKAAFNPAMNREGRIAAMKDESGNHMVVMTHQSIRDDLVYLMSTRMGKNEDETKKAFNAMSEKDRADYLGETLKDNGISFDMLTIDEAHYTTNRKGKEDSTLANVLDALNKHTPYYMNQTATPVKNDPSEAFDILHKVAPDKFNNRNDFLKKYGVDSPFARESLQRLINRYNYASRTVTGVKSNRKKEAIPLSAAQQAAYDDVNAAFQRASRAKKAGGVDVEAVKLLSPNSFKGKPDSEHQAIAEKIQAGLGTMKEEALNRVVNQFDPDNNAKVSKLMEIIESKRYDEDMPRSGAKKGDRAPGIVFAHNLASVSMIKDSLEKKGLRVGVIQGTMSGAEKDKVKVGYNPPNPAERQYDMLVLSDAGATGLNLQNSKFLINYDLPQTSWVKQQREGRIDRHGQAHKEIDYHDLVTDTEHEDAKWKRIQRKAKLGAIFEDDMNSFDDSGLGAYLAAVKAEKYNNGEEGAAA